MRGDPQLVSRARGAMLGLVAGNQLGVPTEYLGTPEAIRKAFPNGLRDLAAPPKNSPYDDDAAMTLLLGESLLASNGFDAADVATRWVRWMKVDGRGIGATTKRALTLIDRGKEPFEAGRLANQENPGRSAGNGSVMRCLPVALRYHDEIERLIRVSTQQAAITHADERCTWGAAAVSLAVRELLHGNIYFVEEVLHRIGDRAPRAVRARDRPADRGCRRSGIRRALRRDRVLVRDPRLDAGGRAAPSRPGGWRHRHQCRRGGGVARRAVRRGGIAAALGRSNHGSAGDRAARRKARDGYCLGLG